ncbi:MAG TPA: phosphonomutase [Clostridiales bacterium]|nr:phosphonomutase [Clostridiales bacterium]
MIEFGTGGWRAVIGDGFTKVNVQLLSSALADMLLGKQEAAREICIGYDRRFLSDIAARWAAEAIAAKGVRCHMIDREAPTPLIMFAVKELNVPYGMAVTASHNPAVYNGVKVFTQGGRDALQSVTDEIMEWIGRLSDSDIPAMEYDEGLAAGVIDEINPLNDYIDSIMAMVDMDTIRKKRLKIALDPMYGVSQTSLRTILMTARCDVLVIHDRHDTLFGGRLPAPNSKTLASLSTFVTENKCHFGIATDGDADRLGVIDDRGAFLHPNQLLVLLYYYLSEYKGWRGAAVRNISTTHLLDRVAEAYGEKCYEVPVGFKHISSKMEQTDALIGGESSGGLTVRGHIHGKDGIYAAVLLTEMVAVTGKSIAELYREILARFGEAFTADAEFLIKPSDKQALAELLFEDKALPDFGGMPGVKQVSYLDGCKVYFENGGWATARFSGTEPLLRIGSEMPAQQQADEAVARFKALVGSRFEML